MINYTINGFNLNQPELGFRLMEQTEYASSIAPRRVNITVPMMHGEIPAWNDPLDTTQILIRVRITDEDPEELENKWNYLQAMLGTGQNNPIVLRRENEKHNLFAHVQLQSMTQPDFYCAAGIITTTILLHNPSGRWQAVTEEDQTMVVPGAQQEVVTARYSSAPITDSLWRIRGPISTISVHNPWNDTGWEWRAPAAVPADTWVIVDTRNYQVWRNTSDDWDAREVDVSRGLMTIGNGMLALTPVPGIPYGNTSNITTVSASGHSSATELVVRSRRTFL